MSDKLKKILDEDKYGLLTVTPRNKPVTSDTLLEQSFLEINEFYVKHGHIPMVNTTDLNERKLGARLRALILDDKKVEALAHFDTHGLLKTSPPPKNLEDIFSDDKFGLLEDSTGVLTLRNIPTNIRKADNIARAHKSKNFAKYEQGFKDTHAGLKSGQLIRSRISEEKQVVIGRYFVFNGILGYVENRGENYISNRKANAKLHVIFENGTESNILLRSFLRTLYRAKEGARIVPKDYQTMPEWQDITEMDEETGRIYLLKSLSEEPQIQDIQNLYKIGYTTGSVENRIKNAQADPTYLMAPVEVIAIYKCLNMNTQKLEHLIHHFFGDVKLEMSFRKADGTSYIPSEWYVVPIDILDRVINLIINGEIVHYRYDYGLKDIVLINE